MNQKTNHFHRWVKFLLVVSILCTLSFVAQGAIAKYLQEKKNDVLFQAKEAYLTSDLLKLAENGLYPEYLLKTGVNEISFQLYNYPDEYRRSEVDQDVVVTLHRVDQNTSDLTKTVTISATGEKEAKEVKFDNLTEGTYLVSAEAVKPYSHTIKATFVIQSSDSQVYYTVEDRKASPVLLVTINTYDYEGNVTLSWPDLVYPDNTNILLKDAAGNTHTFMMEQYSQITFQFYKNKSDQIYTKEHILLSTH